jgi:methyl-accepting chemotaxis protein
VVSAKAETDLRENAERVAAETLQANQEIVELAQKITSSVRQLSLLSVNARIEAARSGPLGAGFGVVANEIKMLADDNGKWASVITEKLS